MKKNIFLLLAVSLIAVLSFVSAGLCLGESGYYVDCYDSYDSYNYGYSSTGHAYNDVRYASYTYQYPTVDRAPKPIFKGSYGNYRYEQYLYGHNPYAYFFSGFNAYPRYGYYGYNYAPAFGAYSYGPSFGYGYYSYYW